MYPQLHVKGRTAVPRRTWAATAVLPHLAGMEVSWRSAHLAVFTSSHSWQPSSQSAVLETLPLAVTPLTDPSSTLASCIPKPFQFQ